MSSLDLGDKRYLLKNNYFESVMVNNARSLFWLLWGYLQATFGLANHNQNGHMSFFIAH